MKTHVVKAILLGVSLIGLVPIVYAGDIKTTPNERYQLRDGLAKDTKTGLIWMRCSLGQKWDGTTCQGHATRYSWDNALLAPQHFVYGGHKDWRIPNHNELKSLAICIGGQVVSLAENRNQCAGDYASPTINQTVFPQTPKDWFWSSSPKIPSGVWALPFEYFGKFAWLVNFSDGFDTAGLKTDEAQVRLVRNDR